ncbi:MAG: DUF4859 domain-containing protein, partial [Paludibacteraceae bacterium]|nr:DUF4859 domain-containing protein [Paludibacteraceae bacterium]
SGYVFSEFDANSLTFSLGQYPGKVANGSNYTIRQAIKYQKGGKTAVATFVFNIHITSDRTGYELKEEATNVLAYSSEDIHPIAYYSILGIQIPSMQQGINLVKMSDGSVRKVRRLP